VSRLRLRAKNQGRSTTPFDNMADLGYLDNAASLIKSNPQTIAAPMRGKNARVSGDIAGDQTFAVNSPALTRNSPALVQSASGSPALTRNSPTLAQSASGRRVEWTAPSEAMKYVTSKSY
jgi:hypothetical protein